MSNSIFLANDLIAQQQLGMGLKSPLQVDPNTQDFARVSGEENVRQCIIDLLSTAIGERVMNEDFGTPFPPMTFENIPGVVQAAPVIAISAITRYEPRVKNVTASAKVINNPSQTDAKTFVEVRIDYVIRATGAKGNLVYPFYLQPPAGTTGT